MIDFRYHLVSIVSVFLALGIGLLLGATALQPSTLALLGKTSQQESAQIQALLASNSQLNHQLASNEQFARAAAPVLLRQLLAGDRVVVVAAPGASGQVVGGITQAVSEAGATISGQIQLQAKFFDVSPATQEQLSQLAQHYALTGQAPLSGTALVQASQVLASAILTKDGPGQPVAGQPDAASAALLNGFGAGGFLTDSGHPDTRATLTVVITPASSPSPSSPVSQGLVTLAEQLGRAGQGTVVAGSVAGSGPDSAIYLMRTSGQAGDLSSVDNADQTIGQIVVAQALYLQLRGVSGSYGATATANTAGPSPAPSPSAAPTVSPSAAATGPSPAARRTSRAGT